MRCPSRATLASIAGAALSSVTLAGTSWSYDRPAGSSTTTAFGHPPCYCDTARTPAYEDKRRPLVKAYPTTSPYGRTYVAPSYSVARDTRPVYVEPIAPVVTYRRPPIWTGLYLGAHGGYTTGTAVLDGGRGSVGFDGMGGGIHLGYNWQSGGIVWGLETDSTWSNARGSSSMGGPTTMTVSHDWVSSLRARVGIPVDNAHLYLTAGAAAGHASWSAGGLASSDTLFGLVLGGGLEYRLHEALSLRIEGLHYMFGDRTVSLPGGNARVDADMTTFRAGLSLHFN
ncbi:MAG TPA: outer membrane beta-barrel protein [Hyphomicrobiaceae bacterium]|nr:outer membrane beta-barrel protein [Hyphomicrobiaceae bacterium]